MNRKKIFSNVLIITSFRINFVINYNPILTTFKNRNNYNFIEEANYFQIEKDEYFDDEIAIKCEINTWRKEYFQFLERNIDEPNKTEINRE